MAMKHGDAHLEIINTEKDGTIRIEGERIDVIFTWMQLSVQVAEVVKVPLPQLLAQCAFLEKDLEKLNQRAESCIIDLSRPVKE